MRMIIALVLLLLLAVPAIGIACDSDNGNDAGANTGESGQSDDSDDNGQSDDSDDNGQPDGPISPTWIDVSITHNTVSIPNTEMNSGKMLHFKVPSDNGDIAFMAYKLDG